MQLGFQLRAVNVMVWEFFVKQQFHSRSCRRRYVTILIICVDLHQRWKTPKWRLGYKTKSWAM